MELRQFGKTDMLTGVLGFGSSEIGFSEAEQTTVNRILNEALDDGLNVIDTAECYKEAEALIGNAVGHRRNEFFLFTKCGHGFGKENGLPDWHPDLITASIEYSLQRLKTDRLDLIQLHSCNIDVLSQGDAVERLIRAKEQGKTRYIGYSGDGQNAVFAIKMGVFDSLQTSANVADQESIDLLLPLAKEARMGVIAKRPVANVAWKSEPASNAYARQYWERLQKLAYPFLKLPLQEAVDTAIRFTLSQPEICTMIVGTQNPARWHANLSATDHGPLSKADLQAIRDRWHEIGRDWPGLG